MNAQFANYGERYQAAYETHRLTYELRNPPPAPVPYTHLRPTLGTVKRGIAGWVAQVSVVRLSLVVMTLAAVIVSGSRTIVEFGGGVVGVAAFAMLELGIVAYAYIEALENADRPAKPVRIGRNGKEKRGVELVKVGMYGAFAVTLAANIHATLKANGVEIDPFIDMSILLAVAISAPGLCLVSGHLFGVEAVKAQRSGERRELLHREALVEWERALQLHDAEQARIYREWQDGLNRAWAAARNDYGIRIEKAAAPQLDHGTGIHSLHSVNEQSEQMRAIHSVNGSLNGANGANGYSKNMSSKDIAREWIVNARPAQPEVMTMRIDDLLTLIQQDTGQKIGRTSVHNARKELTEISFAEAGDYP